MNAIILKRLFDQILTEYASTVKFKSPKVEIATANDRNMFMPLKEMDPSISLDGTRDIWKTPDSAAATLVDRVRMSA